MASIQWTRVESRNRDKTTTNSHLKTSKLKRLISLGRFKRYGAEVRANGHCLSTVYIESFAKLFKSTDISIWKKYIDVKVFSPLHLGQVTNMSIYTSIFTGRCSAEHLKLSLAGRALNEVEAHVGEMLGNFMWLGTLRVRLRPAWMSSSRSYPSIRRWDR